MQPQEQALVDRHAGVRIAIVRKDAAVLHNDGTDAQIGVDYAAQFAASGKRATVKALYRKAGLSFADDRRLLADAQRIAADPRAVAYMRANFVEPARLTRPVLSIHTISDGATMVTYQQAYRAAVARAGSSAMLAQAYGQAPGHCTFELAESLPPSTRSTGGSRPGARTRRPPR